jgi:hypothetical protein
MAVTAFTAAAAAFQMPPSRDVPPIYVGGACEEGVVLAINATARTLDVVAPALDNNLLAEALAGAQSRGVRVRVLVDQRYQYQLTTMGPRAAARGADVRIYDGGRRLGGTFAVFDGEAVAVGSYDWTLLGRGSTDYLIFVNDPAAVAVFRDQFDYAWNAAPPLAPPDGEGGYVASRWTPWFHKDACPFAAGIPADVNLAFATFENALKTKWPCEYCLPGGPPLGSMEGKETGK